MWAILVACHELVVDYNSLPMVPYAFEHKTRYISIYTHIITTWYFDMSVIYPNDFRSSQICYNIPHVLYSIAAIFMKYCFTTSSWLF